MEFRMQNSEFRIVRLALGVALVVMLAIGDAFAQDAPPPPPRGRGAGAAGQAGPGGGRGRGGPEAGPIRRLPDGKPDLSGFYNGNGRGANYGLENHPTQGLTPGGQGIIVDPPDGKLP